MSNLTISEKRKFENFFDMSSGWVLNFSDKDFAEFIASSTGLKLEAKTIAPFTLRDRPQDLDYSALGALEHLEKGQVSDMTVNSDKGVFVYAADKKAPALDDSNPRYAETRQQLASYTARMSSSAYIAEIVQKELKKSEPKTE